jgi:hypothetical protein
MKKDDAGSAVAMICRYCHNFALFSPSYFESLLRTPERLPRLWNPPTDVECRLKELSTLWGGLRERFLEDDTGHDDSARFVGLPVGVRPRAFVKAESAIENGFIGPILSSHFGYGVTQNTTFAMQGEAAEEALREGSARKRPDFIVFRDTEAQHTAETDASTNGVRFCRTALFIVDAKSFKRGVDADEADEQDLPKSQRHGGEGGAIAGIRQVDRYLRGYDRPWGVLTNGRSWRLMRQGETRKCLRFDLVLFLEDLRGREPTADDLRVFTLFWNLFGPPAVAGGVLDALLNESTANTRRVRDALRDNAHEGTRRIAQGFWQNRAINTAIPDEPDQATLDHLREIALTLLYRLLFVLKAEAQNLLPMQDDAGASTTYATRLSIGAIDKELEAEIQDRPKICIGYEKLQRLFKAVSDGDATYGVAAYNGGLFDPSRHSELERMRLTDQVLKDVFDLLIYLPSGDTSATPEKRTPIPYRDLDVRDLGDIYESLLEQRLLIDRSGVVPSLVLRNQKGERKASGSFFTPDRLVEHLVRKTVDPLLAACGSDPVRILNLRILDPAMGSGHFLVKAVDVMADYLTEHCTPLDPGAPAENGDMERAYWRAKVVEHCIYGVDYNPMAVELAKVALWLHCARRDKPLSFLDHHLKCGNSLVGVTVDRLTAPGREVRSRKSGPVWGALPPPSSTALTEPDPAVKAKRGRKKAEDPRQLRLPFQINTTLLSGIITSIRAILERPSDKPEDVKTKSKEYADAVSRRLAAHRLLADLWCAQWFVASPANAEDIEAYSPGGLYDKVKHICGILDDGERWAGVYGLGGMPEQPPTPATPPLISRLKEARAAGYGPRPLAFFHWQLEFPEVAFADDGCPKPGFGFDAVVGNPPWDKIKPAKRDYYGPFNPEVANTQGASLNRLISGMESADPKLASGWSRYEKAMKDTVAFLADSGFYRHQSAIVEGSRTGGDPDLFRYFVERADQCLGLDGRFGLVVPGALWQGEGCTGLRRLLLKERTVESLYVFENYRKWAFDIDSRFKLTVIVVRAGKPEPNHAFPAAFMLRDTRVLDGLLPERVVRLPPELIDVLSPDTLALLDFRCDADAQLMARLHRQFPALGDKEKSAWSLSYRCDLHMTQHSWRFKYPHWMARRGFTLVRPVRETDGSWRREIIDHGYSLPPEKLDALPAGGEYWVAADAGYYEESNYERYEGDVSGNTTTFYVSREDLAEVANSAGRLTRDHFRILPGAAYTALYEGRMVGSFDHAKKVYVEGGGRRAVWKDLATGAKLLHPRVFVALREGVAPPSKRLGFCNVTGATNERSFLGTLIPASCLCGHGVPTLSVQDEQSTLEIVAILNSIIVDAILRLRVSTNLSMNFLTCLAVPVLPIAGHVVTRMRELTLRLSCTTPELADYWNVVFLDHPWTYASAERDPWKRAELRAECDAIVAELYGLSVPEYARILTGFPLLDRDCRPSLPGDFFATECDADRAKCFLPEDRHLTWDENNAGVWEFQPRSFITRDFALLTYIKRRQAAGDRDAYVPERLDEWFRDVVGLDPNGPLSRFRIGEVKNLRERVERAKALGAIPYVPSGSNVEDCFDIVEIDGTEVDLKGVDLEDKTAPEQDTALRDAYPGQTDDWYEECLRQIHTASKGAKRRRGK